MELVARDAGRWHPIGCLLAAMTALACLYSGQQHVMGGQTPEFTQLLDNAVNWGVA